MINHDILFIGESSQAKFAASLLRREKFLDSVESIKLLSTIQEAETKEEKLRSYIVTIKDGVGVVNISGELVNDDCRHNRYWD
ncbi:hypothetical protein KAU11_08385, partial [Candidatus Babeliales bacterium]|nr:hypothetical protein [Candidatus Babeliales bacterium]